jgi:tetratricopeptide (TPR) repeat protein
MILVKNPRRIYIVLFLAMAALGALCGCDGPAPPADNSQSAATPTATSSAPAARSPSTTKAPPASRAEGTQASAPAAGPAAKPITDDEAQAFAKTLETAFKSKDGAAIGGLYDYDALLHCALEGFDIDEQTRQRLIDANKPELAGSEGIAARQARSFVAGERDRLLRAHRQGDQQRVLFRCLPKAVDYVDYVLVRSADGKVRIGDFYDYIDGWESEGLHWGGLAVAAHAKPDLMNRLSPADREYCTFVSTIEQMHSLIADGRFKEALDAYQRLPDALKNHPHVLHDHLIAASQSEGDFDETIRGYRVARPDDLGVDVHLMGYYLRNKRWDEFLSSIDRLDKAVGGDAYLDGYRSLAHAQKGNLAAAKKCAETALAAEPDEPFTQGISKMVAQAENDGPAKQPAAGRNPAAAPRGEPVGDEEATAFADAFAKGVMTNDAVLVRAAMDIPAVYQRALVGITVPQQSRSEIEQKFPFFMDSIISGLASSNGSLAQKGGSFQLLRLHRENGEQRAMFRIIEPAEGVDYMDCTLARHADGKLRIDDFYAFSPATSQSEIARRFILLMLERAANPTQAAAGEPAGDNGRYFRAGNQMSKLQKAGKYQAALDVYEALPEILKKDKSLLSERISAAKHLKGKPYDDAIRAYRQAFPNEPNLNLIMIDGYLQHKMYDRALGSIDALDQFIGGDPYLNVERANAYRLNGDRGKAKTFANKAIAAEPGLRPAYDCLLAISLNEKKFSETARLLTAMQKKFPAHMPSVATDPAYAEYVKSPAYRTWARSQR